MDLGNPILRRRVRSTYKPNKGSILKSIDNNRISSSSLYCDTSYFFPSICNNSHMYNIHGVQQFITITFAICRTIKKPVGILHVNVVRAIKLLKADFLGASDPYVKLKLRGEKVRSKRTSIKKKTLNPEWKESFKITVKDPETQVLELHVYDWDKVFVFCFCFFYKIHVIMVQNT